MGKVMLVLGFLLLIGYLMGFMAICPQWFQLKHKFQGNVPIFLVIAIGFVLQNKAKSDD